MNHSITLGQRRFTRLSPRLVRLEFAPDGVFEDRRSLVACEPRTSTPFESVAVEGEHHVLKTGALEIWTRQNERAFFPANLEARWESGGLQQYWRPHDRDHRNLGGTLRSLDRFGDALEIGGVHVADGNSPDTMAREWIAWLQCEEDPPFYERSPDAPPRAGDDWNGAVKCSQNNLLERTRNAVLDHLQYPPGVLSRSGYFLLNDSDSPVLDDDDFPIERNRPGAQDWFLFAYGDDYRAALGDFVALAGRAPLPPKHVFGLQFSRWPAFGEAESREIAEGFRARGLPLSTLIVDMEWHREGWGHWDWNEKLFPDPKRFFAWCRANDLATVLNDHPLDVRADDSHYEEFGRAAATSDKARDIEYNGTTLPAIAVDMGAKAEANAFVETCHRPISDLGLSYWWNDGCRGELNGAINQLLANKLFYQEIAQPDKRGWLMARYGGLGSHRYGAFFTGDTLSCWEILRMQCEFNIRAGGVGVAYVSHDIGGFFMRVGAPLLPPELYVRWVQFGAFNAIFRFHSAPGSGSRLPWDYGEKCEGIAARWLRVRHSLQPHLYAAARAHHDSGVPIIRGLYLDNPRDENCYRFDQFLFGDGLMCAPMLSSSVYREVYLPQGEWWEFEKAEVHAGNREIAVTCGLGEVPLYVRAGTVLVRQHPDSPAATPHVARLILDVYPGESGSAELYEDDGQTPAYQSGQFCRTRFDLTDKADGFTLTSRVIEGVPLGETREIAIEFSSARPIEDASCDGESVEVVALATAGRYRVNLGERISADSWEVAVRYAE